MASFIGAGLYRNHVPAAVFQLVTRGEVPDRLHAYQAEVSQGAASHVGIPRPHQRIGRSPVANLSVYDGSSAAAEAITCAVRVHGRKATQQGVVYVSELVPPDRWSVIHNYTQGGGIELRKLRHLADGTVDPASLAEAAGACAVYVEQPNPLGLLDASLVGVKDIVGEHTAFIVGVNPVSLGLYEAPGHYGRHRGRRRTALRFADDRRRSNLRHLRLLQGLHASNARPHRRPHDRRRRANRVLPDPVHP